MVSLTFKGRWIGLGFLVLCFDNIYELRTSQCPGEGYAREGIQYKISAESNMQILKQEITIPNQ